ncbi:MAG: hypothetical protein HZB39_15230 [Planctomycetes bacterium]|nr:hypothetical protein [Planctomycetota bacterium]
MLAACGAAAPPAEPERARIESAGTAAIVRDQVVTLVARTPAGVDSPVAEFRAIRFDDGSGPRDLSFRSWSRTSDQLRVDVVSPPDHEITVELMPDASGALRVRVSDRIRARAKVTELALVWTSLSADAPDEIEMPLVHAGPDGLATDAAFRAPIAFVRQGDAAFAVLPDLDALAAARPLPQALTVGGAERPSIRHALRAETQDGRMLRREVVGLEHTVQAFVAPRASTALRDLRNQLWLRHATPRLTASTDPLSALTLADAASSGIEELSRSPLRRTSRGGQELLAVVDPDDPDRSRELVRFGATSNALAAALAFELGGRREHRDDWRAVASRITAFALAAPRRGGLVPHALARSLPDGAEQWLAGDPHGPHPTAFAATDSARTGLHLIELAALQSEHASAIRAACAELARFFADNQAADGSIPAFFDGEYLRPLAEPVPAAASSGPAAFLARWSSFAGDAAMRRAAERAVRHIAESALPARDFADPSQAPLADRDTRLGHIDLLPLALAAIAATELAASDGESRDVALRLLDELAGLQQVWDPPWLGMRTFGGFARSNAGCVWNDGNTSLGATALLEGYLRFGRRIDLERGVAALRAALVQTTPFDAASGATGVAARHLAAAIASAERWSDELGQVAVDLGGDFALGVDGLLTAGFSRDANRISLRVASFAELDSLVRVRFHHAQVAPASITVNGVESREPRALLRDGVTVAPELLPKLEFRPPPMLVKDAAWRPIVRSHGAVPGPGTARLVVEARGRNVALPLVPDQADLLTTAAPFPTFGMAEGDELRAWVELDDRGFTLREPRSGARVVTIGAFTSIDPGDDLETALVGPDAGSSTVRFADGREFARRARRGESFAYRLELPGDASSLELRLRVAGALLVSTAIHGEVLLREAADTDHSPRDLEIRLADPRLWADGHLTMRFEPASDEPIELARIEYRGLGSTATAASAGEAVGPTAPEPSIELAVVPLVFGGESARSTEPLRQAVFGGDEYRLTPEPAPRPTFGSLARYVERASGGRTMLGGDIVEPLVAGVAIEALAANDPGALSALQDTIAGALHSFVIRHGHRPDVVLAVYEGTPHAALEGRRIESPDSAPIVLCSERESDGTFLSCGRLAYRLLASHFGFTDLSDPIHGNFGELSLDGAIDVHAGFAPAGPNLLKTSWATLVDVTHQFAPHALRLSPSLTGRTLLRIDVPPLDELGATLLETRPASSAPGDSGLSIYRLIPPGGEPTIHLLDGRSVQPRIWRISAARPAVRMPFEAGSAADLFRSASRLDARSSPVLATPFGEAPWQIDDLRIDARGDAAFSLRWLGIDVFDLEIGWRAGTSRAVAPLPADGVDRGVGAVERLRDGLRVALPDRDDAVVAGSTTLPQRATPLRLFGRIAAVDGGTVELVLRTSDRELSRSEFDAGGGDFRVDLPGSAMPTALTFVLRRTSGAPLVRFAHLTAVPRSGTEGELSLAALPSVTTIAGDGTRLGAVRTLKLDSFGRASLHVPAIVPAGNGLLRLVLGRAKGAVGELRISAELREANGKRRSRLIVDHAVPVGTGPRTVIAELPSTEERRVGFLELSAAGEPGQELAILEACLARG